MQRVPFKYARGVFLSVSVPAALESLDHSLRRNGQVSTVLILFATSVVNIWVTR